MVRNETTNENTRRDGYAIAGDTKRDVEVVYGNENEETVKETRRSAKGRELSVRTFSI